AGGCRRWRHLLACFPRSAQPQSQTDPNQLLEVKTGHMKKFSFSIPLLAATMLAATFSCEKKNVEYRDMQPTREVNMSTYDFIKSANKGGLYDTLIYLLDKTGLAE